MRDIDWNVTARMDRTYVKVYEEERELTVMLVVDVSGSLDFGTRQRSQRQLLTEVAATLAFSAMGNNDKVGALFVTDRVELYIPPGKGRSHILHIIRQLLVFEPQSRRTNLAAGLEFLTRVQRKRSIAFVLSDFVDSGLLHQRAEDPQPVPTEAGQRALSIAARKHDVVAVQVYDPVLEQLPRVGLLKVRDAETGHEQIIDTLDERVRRRHSLHWLKQQQALGELLVRHGVDHTTIATNGDYAKALTQLFGARRR